MIRVFVPSPPYCGVVKSFNDLIDNINIIKELREAVKYYFADFVRKGGGRGYPPNP